MTGCEILTCMDTGDMQSSLWTAPNARRYNHDAEDAYDFGDVHATGPQLFKVVDSISEARMGTGTGTAPSVVDADEVEEEEVVQQRDLRQFIDSEAKEARPKKPSTRRKKKASQKKRLPSSDDEEEVDEEEVAPKKKGGKKAKVRIGTD